MRRSGRAVPERRREPWRDSVAGCACRETRLERYLVPWRATACHRLLEVMVEEFVRIVLGGMRRQVEEFDPVDMILHPGGDPVRPMDRQVVDDDEQLAGSLAD